MNGIWKDLGAVRRICTCATGHLDRGRCPISSAKQIRKVRTTSHIGAWVFVVLRIWQVPDAAFTHARQGIFINTAARPRGHSRSTKSTARANLTTSSLPRCKNSTLLVHVLLSAAHQSTECHGLNICFGYTGVCCTYLRLAFPVSSSDNEDDELSSPSWPA